jgi:phage protein D
VSALSISGAGGAPGVRRPVLDVSFGALAADAVLSVAVDAGPAPGVDRAELVVADGADAPAPGDSGTVSLGYADSGAVVVFTGEVGGVSHDVRGNARFTVTNGGAALGRARVEKSYESQSAGDVVSDLASTAGVSTGTIQPGPKFAFYALDDRRPAYAHVARLARSCGFLAYFTPAGELVFGAPTAGAPAQTFTYAVDVLALELTAGTPVSGAITTVGEGAAGSEGTDAWSWLVVDPSSVTGSGGSGDPERRFADASLRSADSAGAVAKGIADRAALLDTVARLTVPGAPDVAVGATVEVAGAPTGALNDSFLVRGIRHRFSRAAGFTTVLTLSGGA